MKMSQSVKTAKRSGQVISFLLLACPWFGFAQIVSPIPVAPPVRITSQANHATFDALVDIPIFAYARLPFIGLSAYGKFCQQCRIFCQCH